MRRRRRSARGFMELPADHIYGVLTIGDDWVETAIMHLDPRGLFYPVRVKPLKIRVKLGQTPSMEQIEKAIRKCWNSMADEYPIEYGSFFVCLPAWCCHSRDVSCVMRVLHDDRIPGLRFPTVRSYHMRKLEEVVSIRGVFPYHVAADLMLHEFVVNGRRTSDPAGTTSKTLGIHAHVTLAELGMTRRILDCLDDMNVTVDGLTSTCSSTGSLLTSDERIQGAVMIDVGTRSTCCTFYQNGTIRYTARVIGGSADAIEGAAAKLHITPDAVTTCVDQWKEASYSPNCDARVADLPLWIQASTHPGIHVQTDAALETVREIARRVEQCINVARREMMLDVRKLVFVGDDYLTVRVLREIMEDQVDIECRRVKLEKVYGTEDVDILGYARVIGTMQQCAFTPRRRQVFLERYNESPFERFTREVSEKARRSFFLALRKDLQNVKGHAAGSGDSEHNVSQIVPLHTPGFHAWSIRSATRGDKKRPGGYRSLLS